MNNLQQISHLHANSGCRFHDIPETSLLYQVRIAINNSGLSANQITERCDEYILPKTIQNLLSGKTRHPQFRTVRLVMQALGWKTVWVKIRSSK